MKKMNIAVGLPSLVIRRARLEKVMALQKMALMGGGRGKQPEFPLEADCEFDEVRTEDIKAWQSRLAEEFGFGNGKWVAVDGRK